MNINMIGNNMISVIIPVYKVEKYLSRCIESVINQTYKDLEIILVDDGSNDSCPQICDKYAEKDGRIVVIHKENGGLSSARNAGIEIAKGEYIAFLDSDDEYYEETSIEKMHNLLKNNSDAQLCVLKYQEIDENGKILDNNISLDGMNYLIDEDEFWKRILFNDNVEFIVAWSKLYRREVFDTVRFKVGKINEDLFLLVDLMKVCKKIAVSNDICVKYRQRSGSIMNNEKISASIDSSEAKYLIVNYLGEMQKYDYAKKAFKEGTVQLLRCYKQYYKKDNDKMEMILEMYKKYRLCIKNGFVKPNGITEKIQFTSFKVSLPFYRFVRNIFSKYKV